MSEVWQPISRKGSWRLQRKIFRPQLLEVTGRAVLHLTVSVLRILASILLTLAAALDRKADKVDREEEGTSNVEAEVKEIKEEEEEEDLMRRRCDSYNSVSSTDSGICEDILDAKSYADDLEEEEEKKVNCKEYDVDHSTGLRIIPLSEVGDHFAVDDAWMVIFNKVYDVTDYLSRHPGGQDVMLDYVGYDATMQFRSVSHSKAAFRTMEKYVVGILPTEERLPFTPDY